MSSGLPFLASTLSLVGMLTALGGVLSALSGMDLKSREPRLSGLWRCAASCPWDRLPGEIIGLSLTGMEKAVGLLFEPSGKRTVPDVVFIVLLFFFVPLASLYNVLLGGSTLLLKIYLAILAAFGLLAVTTQLRRNALFALISGVLSMAAGVGLFLGVPVYVLTSFSNRLLYGDISHIFMLSLLTLPFYYAAAYSAINFVELFAGRDPTLPRGPALRFVYRFIAALPGAFLLFYLALLFGQMAVKAPAPDRTVQQMLVTLGLTALSLPLSMAALSPLTGRKKGASGALLAMLQALGVAAGLSVAVLYLSHLLTPREYGLGESLNVLVGLSREGAGVSLGPDFWVMHLPFLPVSAVLGFLAVGGMAKGMTQAFAIENRFHWASAALLGVLGVGLFALGRALA